jgi:hypothetical protein
VTRTLRDFLQLAGAIVAAVFVGALLRRLIEPRWEFMLAFACLFAAAAAVKQRWPAHSLMSRVSWPYLGLMFVLLEASALLLADWRIVGVWWTIPAVVCLGLLYCIVHLAFGQRRG